MVRVFGGTSVRGCAHSLLCALTTRFRAMETVRLAPCDAPEQPMEVPLRVALQSHTIKNMLEGARARAGPP